MIASLSICPNVLLAISAIYFNLQCFVVFYDSSDDQNYDEHNHSFRLTTIITPTMPPEWSARPVMTGCSKSLRVTESHRESPRVTQSDDGDRNFLIETISLFAERRQWRELSNFETRSAWKTFTQEHKRAIRRKLRVENSRKEVKVLEIGAVRAWVIHLSYFEIRRFLNLLITF